VSTADLPLSIGVASSTTDGASWLTAQPVLSPVYTSGQVPMTPATIDVFAGASQLPPGTYSGAVTISAPANSSNVAAVPVTLTVAAAPPPQPQSGTLPLVTAVLNAGSQATSGISPGELLTIFGQNIGPATPVGFTLGADGRVTTVLGGAQVMFDGIAAPLLYASSTQLNVIAPYEIAGSAATSISALFNGTTTLAGAYPVVASSPGIFTLGSGGSGQGAVLNQDGSLNSASNPAPRGSIIQIYFTGQGVTNPTGITGEITGADPKQPILPVAVTIGGANETLDYAGSAPDSVSGLCQINATVPTNISVGDQVPIFITVGSYRSQNNVSLSVR